MIATATATQVRTAIVRAADGIRFTASAPDEDGLTPPLLDYVESRCDDVLWPATAREIRSLIAARRHADAIAAYFSAVGQRWDEEWLEVTLP